MKRSALSVLHHKCREKLLRSKLNTPHREDGQEISFLRNVTGRPARASSHRASHAPLHAALRTSTVTTKTQLVNLLLSLPQLRLEVCAHLHHHVMILSDRLFDFLPGATHGLSNWASAMRSRRLSVSQQHETESSRGTSSTFAPRTSAFVARAAPVEGISLGSSPWSTYARVQYLSDNACAY